MLFSIRRFPLGVALVLIMMKWISETRLHAQDSDTLSENLKLEFRETSWFAGEVATAWVFISSGESPEIEPVGDQGDVRIVGTRVLELENDDRGNFLGIVEFAPKRAGIRIFPPVVVKDGDTVARTVSRQIVVGEPYKTDAMSFQVEAGKRVVYEGEPLKVSFEWRCDLPMNQIRHVQLYPEIFNNPDIEIVVPRSDAPEELQFGIPVSERRVIAQRFAKGNRFPENLGVLRFDFYLRFRAPGTYMLPKTRLQCSRLLEDDAQSNRYAAYFNNALFERVDSSSPHERIYADSDPLEITVRPLPGEGRLDSFSGIFDPQSVSVSIRPPTATVGQLIEIQIDVRSDVCSEMLQIPDMSRQSSMRNRFWVGQEANEIWRSDGRRFVMRARPLTTQIATFPSLSFQVFDSNAGSYRLIKTEPLSFDVKPLDGLTFFPMEKIPGAQISIAATAEGVWHNQRATTMGDVLNGILDALASGVWLWFGLGLLILGLGAAWAKEARRRSRDADYSRKIEAIEGFRKTVSRNSSDFEALRQLVGDYFGVPSQALTANDVGALLEKAFSDDKLIGEIREEIDALDLPNYQEEPIATERSKSVKEIGGNLIRLLKGSAMILFATGWFGASEARANTWKEAESLFAEALQMAESVPDIEQVNAKFAEAALAYERSANDGIRPGVSWYNAGNAWFQIGEVGRSIANYKQSLSRRPFDERVSGGLQAARGLRIDRFASGVRESVVSHWGMRAAFSATWLVAAALIVIWIRFRGRYLLIATCLVTLAATLLGGRIVWGAFSSLGEGVVIAEEIYARKGPGYAYASAFLDPIHDGLEVKILEIRSDWLRARVADGSECWLPQATVQRLVL